MASTAQQPLKSKEERRNEEQARARARTVVLVDKLLKEKAPDLVAHKPEAGLSTDDCEAIALTLRDEVQGTYYTDARKYLREKLKSLREITGGQVALPPPATRIRRDRSPFAGQAFQLATQLEVLVEQFFEDLKLGLDFDRQAAGYDTLVKRFKDREPEQVIAQKKQKLTIGRILFSAIVNGGMIHRKLYSQLPELLCDAFQAYGDHAWIAFPLAGKDPEEEADAPQDPNDPAQPVRRWLLDPVTLGLVTRWRLDQPLEECRLQAQNTKSADALRSYLSYLRARAGTAAGQAPKFTTKTLFDAATARLSLYLPQILVRFLKSVTEGSSMSERSWWRYAYDLQVQYTPPRQDEAELGSSLVDASLVITRFSGDKAQFFTLQESLLTVLNECLNDASRSDKSAANHVAAKAIQETLKARQSDMAPILNAWFRWVHWKLTRASKPQGRIKTSSALRYTSRLGDALIEIGVEMAVEGTSTSDWEAFYQDVLNAIKSKKERGKAVGNLLQFHEFMMASFDVPPAIIEGQSGTGSRPRICLVTENDYQRVMTALENGGEPTHRHRMLRLIAMLMFRVGLRPQEILGLEYRLIQGASWESLKDGTAYPVLYLRVTSQEDLKTSSSVRQIPLPWFLTPAELAEFKQYLTRRLKEYRTKDQRSILILSKALHDNQPLKQGETLGFLTALLRSVTGDPEIVAYSLRHSCFSHLFDALLSTLRMKYADKSQDGEGNDAGQNDAEKNEPRNNFLISQFMRNGHLPREVAYSISNSAGHLDPIMTLQFYIHLQDFISHQMLCELQRDLPLTVWSTLEGVGCASIEQRRRRRARAIELKREAGDGGEETSDNVPQWLDTSQTLIRKLKCPKPKTRQSEHIDMPSLEFPDRSLLDLDMDVINTLLMSGQRSHSIRARAESFDLPVDQIKHFYEACLVLAEQTSSSYSGQHRPRNIKIKNYDSLPEIFRRPQPGSFGPAPPNTRMERAEADRIFKLLGQRAIGANMDPATVDADIIQPVTALLTSQARSESVIRSTSAEQFTSFIATLRALRIDPQRIEIEIESLPLAEQVDAAEWFKRLCKMSGTRKLKASERNATVTRRSRHYPEFGIVKIRVLEMPNPQAGELTKHAKARAGERAGAGWRVGCFYAVAALTALLRAEKV